MNDQTGNPAAGWYPDPSDPSSQRYWNGAAWTPSTRPVNGAAPRQPAQGGYVTQPRGAVTYRPGPTTRDGVPLASWLRRAGDHRQFPAVDRHVVRRDRHAVRCRSRVGCVDRRSHPSASARREVPSLFASKYGLVGPYLLTFVTELVIWFLFGWIMLVQFGQTLGQKVLNLRADR